MVSSRPIFCPYSHARGRIPLLLLLLLLLLLHVTEAACR
jgi:hypothetical protein